MNQYQEKLKRGLELLKKAGSDRDLLGLALISLHGALEDYFRDWLASSPKVPTSEQIRAKDKKQVQWLELLELMQKYNSLKQGDRSYILRMNKLRQEVGHGNPYTGGQKELESYAGYVRRYLAQEQPSERVKEASSSYSNDSTRGDDLRLDLAISFYEAVWGAKDKIIKVPHLEKCNNCNGFGGVRSNNNCSVCNGLGRNRITKTLKIEIPPGVDKGTRLQVAGEGDAGKRGGPPGDLYVYLFIEENSEFKRDGINILSEVIITQKQASSGCTLTIKTLDATGELKIPAGVKHGAVLRLKNRGVPQLNNPSYRGDHLVTVKLKLTNQTKINKVLLANLTNSLLFIALFASTIAAYYWIFNSSTPLNKLIENQLKESNKKSKVDTY
jgi:DnaJ-class molecular chaperone